MKPFRILAAAAAAFFVALPAVASTAPPRPKLIVAISMDQFSAAVFAQNRQRFTGGLRRLTEGAVFPNGFQSHAATETCPGHSTLMTGRHPSGTGIVSNIWYDVTSGAEVYCVYDPSGPVPGRPKDPRGPANLKASTLGEWLKAADPRSRNFAVSGKDRAAITMAGHNPDGVFWWDDENGFTTSVPQGTDEAERLAPVAEFNAALSARWAKAAPQWTVLDKSCNRFAETRRYDRLELTSQAPPAGWAPPKGPAQRGDAVFKRWFRASPMFDETTLDLAGSLIDRFHLGAGPAADVLSVSLSGTDYVGHRYGNQGPEMCDQLAHVDRALGRFLDKLQALHVPVVVVLSADHGSVDAAERAADRAMPARRLDLDAVVGQTSAAVRAELGLAYEPLTGDGQQIYVVKQAATELALRERIVARAVELVRKRPEVVEVFTREQALATRVPAGKPVEELSLLERVAESTDAERSADIDVVFQPYSSAGHPKAYGDSIAGHGSPWNYDRRVPIVFWWPGAEGFEQSLPVETVDIAPTLAALAGVKTPQVDGRCLDLDRTAADSCKAP